MNIEHTVDLEFNWESRGLHYDRTDRNKKEIFLHLRSLLDKEHFTFHDGWLPLIMFTLEWLNYPNFALIPKIA